MEVKVNTKTYQGEIYDVKLNHWLQWLEEYFIVHDVDEVKKVFLSQLKLEGHKLTWWESQMETLTL
jgi:hypothetical protein